MSGGDLTNKARPEGSPRVAAGAHDPRSLGVIEKMTDTNSRKL